MNKQISIIVPVYNAEKYIDECMESIVNQTYSDIEVILINDGSKDTSKEICDEWSKKDNRIRLIHQENAGASAARNVGLCNCTGRYVMFVDCDDWLEPDACLRMMKLMEQYDADLVIAELQLEKQRNVYVPNQKNTNVKVWEQSDYLDFFFRIHGESSNHNIWGKLIKRSVLKDFSFVEGRMNEDILANYELALASEKIIYTSEIVYHYFSNSLGVTRSRFDMKKMDLLYIWDLVYDRVCVELPQYIYPCEMNRKRASFTLLTLMRMNGYDKTDQNLRKIYAELKSSVRRAYWELLKWNMPLSRKVLMTLLIL